MLKANVLILSILFRKNNIETQQVSQFALKTFERSWNSATNAKYRKAETFERFERKSQ